MKNFIDQILCLGTHVLVGCLFTSALKSDENVQHLLKEFVVSSTPTDSEKDSTTADNDSVLPTVN